MRSASAWIAACTRCGGRISTPGTRPASMSDCSRTMSTSITWPPKSTAARAPGAVNDEYGLSPLTGEPRPTTCSTTDVAPAGFAGTRSPGSSRCDLRVPRRLVGLAKSLSALVSRERRARSGSWCPSRLRGVRVPAPVRVGRRGVTRAPAHPPDLGDRGGLGRRWRWWWWWGRRRHVVRHQALQVAPQAAPDPVEPLGRRPVRLDHRPGRCRAFHHTSLPTAERGGDRLASLRRARGSAVTRHSVRHPAGGRRACRVGGGRCGLERPRRRARIRQQRPPSSPAFADDIANRPEDRSTRSRLCRSDRTAHSADGRPDLPQRRGPSAAEGRPPGRADRQDGRQEVAECPRRVGSPPGSDRVRHHAQGMGEHVHRTREARRGVLHVAAGVDEVVGIGGVRDPGEPHEPFDALTEAFGDVGELDAARPEPVRHLGGPQVDSRRRIRRQRGGRDDRPGRAVPRRIAAGSGVREQRAGGDDLEVTRVVQRRCRAGLLAHGEPCEVEIHRRGVRGVRPLGRRVARPEPRHRRARLRLCRDQLEQNPSHACAADRKAAAARDHSAGAWAKRARNASAAAPVHAPTSIARRPSAVAPHPAARSVRWSTVVRTAETSPRTSACGSALSPRSGSGAMALDYRSQVVEGVGEQPAALHHPRDHPRPASGSRRSSARGGPHCAPAPPRRASAARALLRRHVGPRIHRPRPDRPRGRTRCRASRSCPAPSADPYDRPAARSSSARSAPRRTAARTPHSQRSQNATNAEDSPACPTSPGIGPSRATPLPCLSRSERAERAQPVDHCLDARRGVGERGGRHLVVRPSSWAAR